MKKKLKNMAIYLMVFQEPAHKQKYYFSNIKLLIKENLVPDAVIFLNVKDEEIKKRVTGRRIDEVTGKTYNINGVMPTEKVIIDRLKVRKDDTPEKITVRLEEFTKEIDNIKKAFQCRLIEIGEGSIDQVTKQIEKKLSERNIPKTCFYYVFKLITVGVISLVAYSVYKKFEKKN
jgi:hypothetical protein